MSKSFQEPENISAKKRELFELLRKEKDRDAARPDMIPSRSGVAPVALSYGQERLWFLDQLTPGNSAYNITRLLRVEGELNFKALENAINEIVRRHEVLRTTFPVRQDVPVQIIHAPAFWRLEICHLEGMGKRDQLERVQSLAAQEAAAPFDLAKGPLFRAKVLRLGPMDHALLYILHHIVSDGWSMEILAREILILYGAFSAGKPSPLPELPVQYADYSVWQRERLGRPGMLAKELDYWKKQLERAPVLELPTDRERPPVQTYSGAVAGRVMGSELCARLIAVSEREQVTLFMLLSTAFKMLLHYYSGQEDFVVGTRVTNRTRAEIEGLIGYFVNPVALRTNLSGDPTAAEILRREREIALSAFSLDVPFERLVAELAPPRDLRRSPLFQTDFIFHNAAGPELPKSANGLVFHYLPIKCEATRFDLECHFEVIKAEIRMGLIYNRDLFDAATAEQMAYHLERVLERIAGDATQTLSSLNPIDSKERAHLAEKRNRFAASSHSYAQLKDPEEVPVIASDQPPVADLTGPRRHVEQALLENWMQILQVKQIGVNDNFFELGGHSLLAVQVVNRIRRSLKVEIPLAALFRTPTISGLTEAVVRSRPSNAGQRDHSAIVPNNIEKSLAGEQI
ncbi:MAG TPA: condensation domain-containing protein [Verrucomicrobiae bacterium]|nr:condensation domain-containing protein [Verrucomicrobiae bacterium]